MCAFSVIYTSNEPAFVVDYAINPNQVLINQIDIEHDQWFVMAWTFMVFTR